jgi:hypothetical protein
MIDDHLTDEEVLKLYDKAVDWTPAAGDLGYRCDLSKDPWLYISLVSAYDESKLLSVEYEGETIYRNDADLAIRLFTEVDKTFGGTLADIRKQKQAEALDFVRKFIR